MTEHTLTEEQAERIGRADGCPGVDRNVAIGAGRDFWQTFRACRAIESEQAQQPRVGRVGQRWTDGRRTAALVEFVDMDGVNDCEVWRARYEDGGADHEFRVPFGGWHLLRSPAPSPSTETADRVIGCCRCACPCALVGEPIPSDGMCSRCREAVDSATSAPPAAAPNSAAGKDLGAAAGQQASSSAPAAKPHAHGPLRFGKPTVTDSAVTYPIVGGPLPCPPCDFEHSCPGKPCAELAAFRAAESPAPAAANPSNSSNSSPAPAAAGFEVDQELATAADDAFCKWHPNPRDEHPRTPMHAALKVAAAAWSPLLTAALKRAEEDRDTANLCRREVDACHDEHRRLTADLATARREAEEAKVAHDALAYQLREAKHAAEEARAEVEAEKERSRHDIAGVIEANEAYRAQLDHMRWETHAVADQRREAQEQRDAARAEVKQAHENTAHEMLKAVEAESKLKEARAEVERSREIVERQRTELMAKDAALLASRPSPLTGEEREKLVEEMCRAHCAAVPRDWTWDEITEATRPSWRKSMRSALSIAEQHIGGGMGLPAIGSEWSDTQYFGDIGRVVGHAQHVTVYFAASDLSEDIPLTDFQSRFKARPAPETEGEHANGCPAGKCQCGAVRQHGKGETP